MKISVYKNGFEHDKDGLSIAFGDVEFRSFINHETKEPEWYFNDSNNIKANFIPHEFASKLLGIDTRDLELRQCLTFEIETPKLIKEEKFEMIKKD